ncbi:hypothetical protein WA158_003286 [Blastocystis sp. Blastoise]
MVRNLEKEKNVESATLVDDSYVVFFGDNDKLRCSISVERLKILWNDSFFYKSWLTSFIPTKNAVYIGNNDRNIDLILEYMNGRPIYLDLKSKKELEELKDDFEYYQVEIPDQLINKLNTFSDENDDSNGPIDDIRYMKNEITNINNKMNILTNSVAQLLGKIDSMASEIRQLSSSNNELKMVIKKQNDENVQMKDNLQFLKCTSEKQMNTICVIKQDIGKVRDLKENEKQNSDNDKQLRNDIDQLILKNKQVLHDNKMLQNDINQIINDNKQIKDETSQMINDINQIISDNKQLISDNEQMKYNINRVSSDNKMIKENTNQIINNNNQLYYDIDEIKVNSTNVIVNTKLYHKNQMDILEQIKTLPSINDQMETIMNNSSTWISTIKTIIHNIMFAESSIKNINYSKSDSIHYSISKNTSFVNSIILNGNSNYMNILNEWIGKEKQWELLFRASEHEYKASEFHKYCDNKRETVTLIKHIGHNNHINIFGGYTDQNWDSSCEKKSYSKEFLFTLSNEYNIPPTKYDYTNNDKSAAILCSSSYGPIFGIGHTDLCICDNCHTDNNSYCYANYYDTVTTSQKSSLFVNTKDSNSINQFIIDDYEVWTTFNNIF